MYFFPKARFGFAQCVQGCIWPSAPHCSPSNELDDESKQHRGGPRGHSLCVCVCAVLHPHTYLRRVCMRQLRQSVDRRRLPRGIPDRRAKLQATSSASAERKSPLFKDSWLLQEHILFQIVMFGQFTLFIRFEINGSQSRRKVNKRLQKVLSHATRLARLRRWGPLV